MTLIPKKIDYNLKINTIQSHYREISIFIERFPLDNNLLSVNHKTNFQISCKNMFFLEYSSTWILLILLYSFEKKAELDQEK